MRCPQLFRKDLIRRSTVLVIHLLSLNPQTLALKPYHRCRERARAQKRLGLPRKNNHFTEMCSGSEEGSCLRLLDSCITQLKAQGPSWTCNESKEERRRKRVNCSDDRLGRVWRVSPWVTFSDYGVFPVGSIHPIQNGC